VTQAELQPIQVTEVVPPGAPTLAAAPMPAEPPQPGGRVRQLTERLVPRTLTARLVVGVSLLLLVIVSAIGAITYERLRSSLVSRLDEQVNAQADRVQLTVNRALSSCALQGLEECPIGNGSGGTATNTKGGPPPNPQKQWLLVVDSDGTVRTTQPSNTDNYYILDLTQSQRTSLAGSASSRNPFTVTTTDGERVQVTTRVVSAGPSSEQLLLVTGLDYHSVSDVLHSLFWLEVAIGGGGILLAVGITAAGMSLALRPLQRVTRTAQEVTAELSPEGAGLDRRVPETDSTTEVGQLATSFNAMLDTVEAEFRARRESEERMRQFLADASHELRTPLTSIRGYAELARMQNSRNGVSTTDDDSITRIETEGTRMSRLVEDLLLLARGDDVDNDTPLERNAIDVSALVSDVVAGVQAAHPEREVGTAVDSGLTVWGDHDQVLRVLRNLATNAAVHTDPAGAIRIEAHREGANVVLQVVDAGPGLPPHEAEHVFERFWRADKARTRVRGGSGLGMSIVAQIVHAHGGQVYFDSSVQTGSTVTVVLPGASA
jgi:two-component system OmpR family sensor kinase